MTEPVAWITTWKNDEENSHGVTLDWNRQIKKGQVTCTPLYAMRELTDEEIANVWDDVRKDAILKSSMKDVQEFARAILRKASEK
jgi:hypothetical protein